MKELLNDPQKISEFISRPENLAWLIPMAIIILALKLVSLWKSAKGDQKAWFIVLGILNTVGILEIIYLLFFMPKEEKKVL
jgi:hypothetical protein